VSGVSPETGGETPEKNYALPLNWRHQRRRQPAKRSQRPLASALGSKTHISSASTLAALANDFSSWPSAWQQHPCSQPLAPATAAAAASLALLASQLLPYGGNGPSCNLYTYM